MNTSATPKLLPTWNDVAFQDIWVKNFSKFAHLKPCDHGGIGLDINYDNNLLKCEIGKHSKRQIDFAAQCCALPFFPLKRGNKADSCIEPLKKEKENFEKFCWKLSNVRNHVRRSQMASTIKALQESIVDIYNTGNYSADNSLDVPVSLKFLADHVPKRAIVPNCNVDYAGGNLAWSKLSQHFLLHPCSGDLNKLCITPFQNETDQHFKPLLSEQVTVELKNEPILQIESSQNEFCSIRLKSSFHLLNINNLEVNSKKVGKTLLYHIASNPYSPMEILSVYDKGNLKLRNMASRKTVWSFCDGINDLSLLTPTWRCDFGSHPFSALCMNEKYMYLFDFREKGKADELFCIKDPSFNIAEELVTTKLWSRNPFQHFIASTDHFMICDERYPKKCVMIWSHALKDYPVYCDIANFQNSTKSAVVIGTQERRKTAAFFIDSTQANINPISLSPPLELSSPSDCIDSLNLHAYSINEILSSRLSCPLTGVSIVPHNWETAFTAFQLTSVGDMFYQDFKQTFSEVIERTYRVTTGCTLTPPEIIMPHLKDCLRRDDGVEACDVEKNSYSRIFVNLSKILNLPKNISANCSLCRLNNATDKELVFSEVCPGCNLDSAQSQHFSLAWTNQSAVIGPTSNEANFLDCDIDYLSQFTDIYSQRILGVWIGSDENEMTFTSRVSSDAEINMNSDNSILYSNFDTSASAVDDLESQDEDLSMISSSQVNMESTRNDSMMDSLDYSEFVPPSQEVRPLVGETLFTPVNTKSQKNRSKISSTAGF